MTGITVKTEDGFEIEVTHADAGVPPGGSGQYLNVGSVWFRPLGGEWIRSKHRSAMLSCYEIKHSKLAELAQKVGTNDRPEASSDRSSTENVTVIEAKQRDSTSDADKRTARKS